MTFNVNKAFEADNGIVLNGGAGVFSGSASPVGQDAPIGSRYLRDNGELWSKHNTGVNDWIIIGVTTATKLQIPDLEITGLSEQNILRNVPASTVVSSGTISLTSASKYVQFFTGTVAGQNVNLPNATTLQVGHVYDIWNFSTQSISIRNNSGTELAPLKTNARTLIILTNNSSANGVWSLTYTLDNGNVFGTQLYYQEEEAETSNNSLTYVNKVTLVTPSLPLGDYLTQFQFTWRSSTANRVNDYRIQRNSVNIDAGGAFIPNVAERMLVSGFRRISNISGVQTYTLDFRRGATATTVFMYGARLFVWRVG